MIVQAVRSLLFYALFLGQTAVVAIVLSTVALFVPRWNDFSWAIVRYWGRSNVFLLRWIVGIRTEVSGAENIPAGGCIIASKHQSDWDIFAILPYTGRPAYIVKRELMRLPFFGRAARMLECIEVDRSRGAEAIPDLLARARSAIDRGCRIVIFPEGTRREPLAPPSYRAGVTRMYGALDVPVVPVALNSGLFWGRNSLILWPGRARAQFLPPIPPGLPTDEFRRRLETAIETASDTLMLEAVDAGLPGPLPERLSDKIAAVREKPQS